MQVPAVTARGAVWITAISALAVYVHATANGWALDDFLIVANNDTAHTMGNALRGFFSPYWDPAFSGSGQYRPLVILMFSLDWVVSGGSTIWFHAVNVLWHVVVSVLAVFVLRRWLPPLGAMTAGVVFAVHPVHVEAVANIVGRSVPPPFWPRFWLHAGTVPPQMSLAVPRGLCWPRSSFYARCSPRRTALSG